MSRLTPSVKVIEKAIRILGLFNPDKSSFTLEEMSRLTDLPKATVFRIVKTLEEGGILCYDQRSGTYGLGLKLLELGGLVYESLSLRKASALPMDRLAKDLKATVLLGIIRDDHLLYLDKREAYSLVRVSSYVGLKRPPHFGMLGMLLFSYMEDKERDRLLKAYPPQKLTPMTITDIPLLTKRFKETREKGYYIEYGEVIEQVVGISAPIRDFSGQVVAAIGAAMMEFQFKEIGAENAVRKVLDAAREISKSLGMRG